MKASLIATFYNEEDTITPFLDSIMKQVRLPDEVILIDGGSTDQTVRKINEFIHKYGKKLSISLFIKKGNRSVGRNEAVNKSQNEIILSTDVGCILDKNWVKELLVKFADKNISVVAGYYKARASTIFQKALVPYVLVMPDKLIAENFLPSTRSMAFKKAIWKKIGGFNERFSHNEDYVFARELKANNIKIAFAQKALVTWLPRKTFKDAFIMFFRFAMGDTESGIVRGKVLLLFLRYMLFIYLIVLTVVFRSQALLFILILGIILYFAWSIYKNYNYSRSFASLIYFPAIQITADAAVLTGSITGILINMRNNLPQFLKQNWITGIPIFIYFLLMMSIIGWGLPNANHPFTYHMDEWHQIQSVRMTIKEGNPNVPGAAYGPLLQFLLSGLFLIPFTLAKLIDPFVIRNSFEQFEMQAKLFEALRFNTLLWGVVSSIGIAIAAKKYLHIGAFFPISIFIFTPLFLTISNYFKYDVALLGWVVLGIVGVLSFAKKSTSTRYFVTGFLFGCALATKISALPLVPLYALSYFLFKNKKDWKLSVPVIGMGIFFATFLIFGIPNVFFGKGDYSEFLYSNLVESPLDTSNFILGMHVLPYMLIFQLPLLFGYTLAITSLTGIAYFLIKIVVNLHSKRLLLFRVEVFLIIGVLLFALSLYVLGVGGTGNRALVLLPFLVLISSLFLFDIRKKLLSKNVYRIIIVLVIMFQLLQSIPWMTMKWEKDPRVTSSEWITTNIQAGSTIGIELIPIYQYIPDLTLKEFYQAERKERTKYNYIVIDQSTTTYPEFVVISNADIADLYLKSSVKKSILANLKKDGYSEVARFYPKGFLTNIIPRREFYIANLGPTAPIPVISIFQKNFKHK